MFRMNSVTFFILLLMLLLVSSVFAADVDRGPLWRPAAPVAEEVGATGLYYSLLRLPIVASFASIGAHPDDDDSGLLAYLSRGQKIRTFNVIANRGEGGQNAIGIELYQGLGVVRTEELLAARRIDGAEQYFLRAYDFGYSKSKDESLEKWGGEEQVIGDIVRFIRTYRPNIVLNHHGVSGGGHGHHQALGSIVPKAVELAADPNAYPEQISEGLFPWTVQKMYERNSKEPNLIIDRGDYDPIIGRSYSELGGESRSNHRTQTMGRLQNAGSSPTGFRLIVNTVGSLEEKEDSFLDGFDSSLSGIANWAANEEGQVPFLRVGLKHIEEELDETISDFNPLTPELIVPQLVEILGNLRGLYQDISTSGLTPMCKDYVLFYLERKIQETEETIIKATGLLLEVFSDEKTVIPGEQLKANINLYNRESVLVTVEKIGLVSGSVESVKALGQALKYNESIREELSMEVPLSTPTSRIFWEVEEGIIGLQGRIVVKDEDLDIALQPFRPYPVTGFAEVKIGDQIIRIERPSQYRSVDRVTGEIRNTTAVVETISVYLSPSLKVLPQRDEEQQVEYFVRVINNDPAGALVTVELNLADGLLVEPKTVELNLESKGSTKSVGFTVTVPAGLDDGNYLVNASVQKGDHTYTRGYQVIDYPHTESHYLYSTAESTIALFDVKMDPNVRIGYIMGPEDGIPEALAQMGIKVTLLGPGVLKDANLSQFDTIVTGRMAYEFRPDLVENNPRLLDWVEDGGVLIVQYNRYPWNTLNAGPYPSTINRPHDRVTQQDAPITILQPENPVFNYPNVISDADFDGWLQERGLYFFGEWDPRYTPLMVCNDPGEESKEGGLMYTQLGKGIWLWTGYAFFRQIPGGVPGGYRLFLNMLSLPNSLR